MAKTSSTGTTIRLDQHDSGRPGRVAAVRPRENDVRVVRDRPPVDPNFQNAAHDVGLVFSNLPRQTLWKATNEPHLLGDGRKTTVEMFKDEPCVVGAYSSQHHGGDWFIEVNDPLTPTAGATSRDGWTTVIPRGEVGENEEIQVILTTAQDHSKNYTFPLAIRVVPSVNSKLASLNVSPGRLDPLFKPRTTEYFLRVPESATSTTLDFTTWNDKAGRCTIDHKTYFVGKGRVRVNIPPECPQCEPLLMTCYGAEEGMTPTEYTLRFVPQRGGDTLLSGIGVLGAPLNRHFDPELKGPYRADLIRGAKEDQGQELQWTQVHVTKVNPHALVSVDGTLVTDDGFSPYLRVPRGESRVVQVDVWTPENPVAESYHLVLSRETGDTSLASSESSLRRLGSWLGIFSTAASSSTAGHYLANAHALQMMSIAGQTLNLPELYDGLAQGFHPFNLEPRLCKPHALELVVAEGSSSNSTHIQGEGNYRALPDCKENDTLSPSNFPHASHAQLLALAEAVSQDFETQLTLIEAVDASFTSIDGVWSQVTPALAGTRRLIALSPEDRIKLSQALESAYKSHQNLKLYATALTVSMTTIAAIFGLYLIVYLAYLRRPISGGYQYKTDPSTGDQVLSAVSEEETGSLGLRPDYPVCLHPTRFISFMCDVGLISFFSAAIGMLTCEKTGAVAIRIFGTSVSVGMLKLIAVVTMIVCVSYVVLGALITSQIANSLVYGGEFCEYHDAVLTHAKARYTPRWCKHIPLLSRMMTMEIASIAPIREASNPSSDAVTFGARESASRLNSSGYAQVNQTSSDGGADAHKYSPPKKAIQVAINEQVYNDAVLNYDHRNARVYKSYPLAKFGETNFIIRNSYNYPLTLHADLQIQHLTALTQLIDLLTFWLPRHNAQFNIADSWKNILVHANRGLVFDWAINRTLLLSAIALAAYTSKTLSSALVLAAFSLASFLVRIPSVLSTAEAKHTRDSRFWEEESERLSEAAREARAAERIWPLCDSEYAARFYKKRAVKSRAGWCGLRGICTDLFGLSSTDPSGDLMEGRELTPTICQSSAAYAIREFVCSLALNDLLFAVLGLILYLRRGTHGNSAMSTIYVCATSLLCLNLRSMGNLYKLGCHHTNEGLHRTMQLLVRLHSAIFGIGGVGPRFGYYAEQLKKMLTADPTCNWHYPKAGVFVARFPVDEVKVVSNELGMHINARVGESSKYHELTVPDRNRIRIYKTLVVNNGLGDSRREIYRTLPIQVPFYRLLREDGSAPKLNTDHPIERLVGTIQIVNHTIRANAAGLPALKNSENDSFFSLYANEEFFPAPGKIRLRKTGHTYSVRYDSEKHQVVVRGPAIVANKHYSLRTLKHQPNRQAEYINSQSPLDTVSVDSSVVVPVALRGRAEALCESPGSLRIEVSPDLAPNLYEEIVLDTPIGGQHVIDPNKIKVHYDPDCAEMFIRFQELHVHPQPYQVSWSVINKAFVPISVAGTAQDNGSLLLNLPHEQAINPNVYDWMTLKDDTGAVIDIDPKQTDAYQFFFPEKPASPLRQVAGRLSALISFIRGGDNQVTTMEEPIPCTVVQCVNPVEKIYRVDPNFHEGFRVLNARMHEFRARQDACENADDISGLWQCLMKTSEYAAFWKRQGVSVIDRQGNLLDPLNATEQMPLFHGQFKQIAQGEAALRRDLSTRLENKIQDIQTQIDTLRVWIRAYNDPVLHTALLDNDMGEWTNEAPEEAAARKVQLDTQKAMYSIHAPNFMYPCNVPDVLISKRPNLSAQFRLWNNILQSWLLFEEGVDLSNAESKIRVTTILRDIMQSLKLCLQSNEIKSRNSYRSVLHYVVGSHSLRGLNCQWRPDSFKAHPALVRIWSEKDDQGSPDFTQYPEWLPCLLRLTPNALQMLLPNGDDLQRAAEGPEYPWQRSTGLYVPLQAFAKFQITENDFVPPHEENNLLLKAMTTRLVCRKNQNANIADNYARRIEDDQSGNEICFTDTAYERRMRYRLMLGHCVPASVCHTFPQNEVDPTLSTDRINVYPLSFRMAPQFTEQWKRAIKMARLHEPHDMPWSIPDSLSPASKPDSSPRNEPTPIDTEPDSTCSSTSSSEVAPPPPPIVPENVISSSTSSEVTPEPEPEIIPSIPTPPPVESLSSESTPTVKSSPEAITLYEGDIFLEGEAKVRDEAGRGVYEGRYAQGKREGQGRAVFADAEHTYWQYRGHFKDDEMCGPADVILNDLTQVAAAEERYSLIGVKGTVTSPKSRSSGDVLAPSEIKCLFEGRTREKLAMFAPEKSSLSKPGTQKVISLIESVYCRRQDSHNMRIMADRFAMNDVVGDHDLLHHARSAKCIHARFLRTFLPHLCKWSDSTCLARMTQAEWRFADGSVFAGNLKENKPTGAGAYYHWPTNTKYQGGMLNGKPHGEGHLVTDGTSYKGGFDGGMRSGHGTYTAMDNQATIKGSWLEDAPSGPIELLFTPDLVKEYNLPCGEFKGTLGKNGHPSGPCRLKMANGTTFEGEMKDGMRNGSGRILDKDGAVIYDGDFRDDVPEGRATLYLVDSEHMYCGEMSKGMRCGAGQLMDKASKKIVYEGIWMNDVPHGRGIMRSPDGEYDGEWSHGKRQGKGRMIFKEHPLPNGKQRVYEGDWANDLPHGVGKYLSDDAAENVYRMDKGQIVNSSVNSYAPTCGKAPEIKTKPNVQPSGMKPTQERNAPWASGGKKGTLSSIVNQMAVSSKSWNATVMANDTFIDPNKIINLERINPATTTSADHL